MTRDFLPGVLFGRGPDRRTSLTSRGADPRRSQRRAQNTEWIPLFRGADPKAVSQALEDSEVLLLAAGTPLLSLGQTNENVFILLSGELVVHLDVNQSSNAGIPIPAGQCIGELSAIDGKPVSATVLSRTDARVLKLSRDVFWDRVMTLPGVASNMMITITERMRRTNEQTLQAQREQLELIHLRKELDFARQLQASMLPLQRPIFPERSDIEVCGFMEPASNVGGDLFDAFFIEDRYLFFCIGDVSGHGIGASLFMARTIGLLRVLAMNTLKPDTLLEHLNDRLCIGNETNLFVTLFCGFLDLASGMLRYSNAGHCAPILLTGGKSRMLAIPRGPLIGIFPKVNFSALEQQIGAGDVLFCYTDGVTEAQDSAGVEFSESRCLEILENTNPGSLAELLDRLRQEVARFTASDILDDDCTMLALQLPAAGLRQGIQT